jgi:hypothetical protein
MSIPRERIEEFWAWWLELNREAERRQDWKILADAYAENATYGWMYTPDEHFMAVGRDQIREYAVGTEMAGLEGWHYDYQVTVIDETKGMIIGFWKQKAGILNDEGQEYEILGIGGSWFGVEEQADGTLRFAWQRDWFDLGSAAHTFLSIAGAGKATPGLLARMSLNGPEQPGHYKLKDLPSSVWPPVVEAGTYITQKAHP